MTHFLVRKLAKETGASLLEYILAFTFIVIACIGIGGLLSKSSKEALKRNLMIQSEMEPCSNPLDQVMTGNMPASPYFGDYKPCQ